MYKGLEGSEDFKYLIIAILYDKGALLVSFLKEVLILRTTERLKPYSGTFMTAINADSSLDVKKASNDKSKYVKHHTKGKIILTFSESNWIPR